MKDIKYIIKRIIVGTAIGLILMLIKTNVFAQTYNIVPSSCGWSTNSSYTTGTISGNTTATNLSSPFYYCSGATGNFWTQRYGIVTPSNASSSSGTLSFNIYGPTISNVILRTGGYDYSCILNTGVEIDNTNNKIYSVTCGNVPNSASRTWTIYTYKASTGTTNIFISSNFVYIPNENISSVISSQTEQQHQDAEQQHQDLEDINNSMNNSTVDTNNSNSTITSISNRLPSSNVLGNLITMPVMLVQKFINALSSNTCTPYSLGSLFGTNFSLPCVNLSNILGAVWTILDGVVSGFIAYEIGKHFVLIFHKLTSLDSNTLEEVYK